MALSAKEVRHVALLSRLELSDDEVDLYTEQLGKVLDYVNKLDALDTSDVAPIHETTAAAQGAGDVHSMKDPTRGGLAMALNEIAAKSGTSIWLDAEAIPVKPSVRAASEMLGLDPLEVTCEGRAVIIASGDTAEAVLSAVKNTRHGADAAIIGEVREERPGSVLLRTVVGGTRVLRKPLGEPIPRVC